MVNDNVQNTGLNMPEYMYQKQEKPIQLITLLADGSRSQIPCEQYGNGLSWPP